MSRCLIILTVILLFSLDGLTQADASRITVRDTARDPISAHDYDLLAKASEMQGDLRQALIYRQEEVKSMEAAHDTAGCDYHYGKLALIYSELGMYPLCEYWAKRAYQYLRSRYTFCDFYGYLSVQIYGLLKEGKTAEALSTLQEITKESPPANPAQQVDYNAMYGNIYAAQGQNRKAEECFLRMMRFYGPTAFNPKNYASEEQMMQDHVYYYGVMGDFYIKVRQYAKARYYIEKILAFPPGKVKPTSLVKFLRMESSIDSASGNTVRAMAEYEKSRELNDSLFDAATERQIAEVKIRYHTREQEQSIQNLKLSQQRQTAELKEARMQKNITVAGIAALLIITALAYNGYRNKQRSNRALRLKQAEINKQNLSLQQLLKEKEWLLKEVHHRVKNNLQIVISLLNTQTDFLDNPSALHAIQDSRERMQAIALIHQKLYQQDQSTLIDMHSYIHEMVSHLVSSFSDAGRIWFHLEVEHIELDISQAVPLGLVLNEAITNAVKYAFPHGAHGTVKVQLSRRKGRDIFLKIIDDGVGFAPGFDPASRNSLGFQLMRLFAEQLEGDLQFRGREGVEISLRFQQQFS